MMTYQPEPALAWVPRFPGKPRISMEFEEGTLSLLLRGTVIDLNTLCLGDASFGKPWIQIPNVGPKPCLLG